MLAFLNMYLYFLAHTPLWLFFCALRIVSTDKILGLIKNYIPLNWMECNCYYIILNWMERKHEWIVCVQVTWVNCSFAGNILRWKCAKDEVVQRDKPCILSACGYCSLKDGFVGGRCYAAIYTTLQGARPTLSYSCFSAHQVLAWEYESRRRKVKYPSSLSDSIPIPAAEIQEKRTRFSLSHDQESIGWCLNTLTCKLRCCYVSTILSASWPGIHWAVPEYLLLYIVLLLHPVILTEYSGL